MPVPSIPTDGRAEVSIRETARRLSSVQKTAKGAPAYSRFVNRKAGRLLAAWAYHAGLTPNQVTAISGLFSLAGIVLVGTMRPSVGLGLVIALCLAVGYAFDSADGQLARLQGGGSPAGEWLDHIIDCAKISTLHLAVLVSFYRFGYADQPLHMAIPLLWMFVGAFSFFVIILNDQIRRAHGTAPPVVAKASMIRSILVSPTDYGVMLLTFVLLGLHEVFLGVYGLLLVANIAYMAMALVRWFRELSRLA